MKCTSKIAFTGIVTFALVSTFFFPVVAQEDEGADALRELKDLRREAKEVYTAEVAACVERELPEARELLEVARRLSESPGATLESQFMAAQLPIELSQACEELLESKRHYPEEFERIKKSHRVEIHSRLLAMRIRQSADEVQKQHWSDELQDSLEESFAMIQEMIEREARETGAEFEQVKRRAVDRKKYRSEIIKRRKSELLYDYDPFGWW